MLMKIDVMIMYILIGLIWFIGAAIVFRLHAKELNMWLFNPIILGIVLLVSAGSWFSLLIIKLNSD